MRLCACLTIHVHRSSVTLSKQDSRSFYAKQQVEISSPNAAKLRILSHRFLSDNGFVRPSQCALKIGAEPKLPFRPSRSAGRILHYNVQKRLVFQRPPRQRVDNRIPEAIWKWHRKFHTTVKRGRDAGRRHISRLGGLPR